MQDSPVETLGKTSVGSNNTATIYQCGNLTYTQGKLFNLFFWLLWGNFVLMFFETIFSRFIPLYFKDLHASNSLIGLMTGSVAGIVNVLFLPSISQWSDRFRSKRGRRIPFLSAMTWVAVISLGVAGIAPETAHFIQDSLAKICGSRFSETSIALTLLCASIVAFHFANMILLSAFNWLLRDVVPSIFMARFLSWFRVVGTLGGILFLWFVFPYALIHRSSVFFGVSIGYLVVFLLMCFKVKEGEYPPPPPEEKRGGIIPMFMRYFRECLTISIFRNFCFVNMGIFLALNCSQPFVTLFLRSNLGLSMDDVGRILCWGAVAATLAFYPAGWLCDKFSALRVVQVSIALQTVISLLAFFLVKSKTGFIIYLLLFNIPNAGWYMALTAATMQIFPQNKFGQLSSGLNVLGCAAMIVGNFFIGALIDLFQSNYQVSFLWTGIILGLTLFPMAAVLRQWRKLGGPENYVPPDPV